MITIDKNGTHQYISDAFFKRYKPTAVYLNNQTDKNYNGNNAIELTGQGPYTIEVIYNDNIVDMSLMFTKCSSIVSLDLSNLKTKNVTSMNNTFSQCYSL